jgi:drug/metabolite transporter (DMT)-like permease
MSARMWDAIFTIRKICSPMKPSAFQTVALLGIPLCIAVGQILFKITSSTLSDRSPELMFNSLVRSPHFWAALIIYGAATLAWIGAIKGIPISRAYMFMALTFVFVPVFSYFFLAERISGPQLVGTGIIVFGIFVTGL